MGGRKQKGTRYFEVIPKAEDPSKVALKLSMQIGELVSKRKVLLDQSREVRKKIYNLSTEIHSHENELAAMFEEMKNVRR